MPPASSSILDDTIAAIGAVLGSELERIAIDRVVVGLFFTGVKLDNGIAGACATPIKTIPEAVCCPSSAMAMPFPGKLRGRRAADLAREAFSAHGIRRAIGIATVNALADYCWRRRPHPDVALHHGVDAFDATEIRPGDRVVVVGAFVPFLKELKRRGQPFLVLEQDPATLKADELPFFRPAEAAAEILPQADVVLITGATLVNNTLEDLLAFSAAAPMCWAASGSRRPIRFSISWPRAAPAIISSAARRKNSCSSAAPPNVRPKSPNPVLPRSRPVFAGRGKSSASACRPTIRADGTAPPRRATPRSLPAQSPPSRAPQNRRARDPRTPGRGRRANRAGCATAIRPVAAAGR